MVFCVAGILVATAAILLQNDQNDADDAPAAPLDYGKPAFTRYGAVVCPLRVLSDKREGHSGEDLSLMFSSIWNRKEKAEELGCEEWQPGIRVYVSDWGSGVVGVRQTASGNSILFTQASELTNDVPGQTSEERKELSENHINTVPHASTPYPGSASETIGSLLTTLPSKVPIREGQGVATDLEGAGAVICPDADALARIATEWARSGPEKQYLPDQKQLDIYGCSYVRPGTPMISEGPNLQNSLAVVTAKLPDGNEVHGVTFPGMFVWMRPREDEASPQAPPESPLPSEERGPNSQDQAGAVRTGEHAPSLPVCIYCPSPGTTNEAVAAHVNGMVVLRILVGSNGQASEIEVTERLGYGLDEKAVEAVRTWRFKPAVDSAGRPVSAPLTVQVNFRTN
jgi:TonB family protein